MFRSSVAVVLAIGVLTGSLLVGIVGAGAAVTPTADTTAENGHAVESVATEPNASLVAVAPNPVASADEGEYVVVAFAGETNLAGWTLGDDETTATLGNRTVSGHVAFSASPTAVPTDAADVTVGVAGFPELANSGEPLTLAYHGAVVDTLRFENAPAGERWNGERWRPRGATDFEPVVTGSTRVDAFVMPDTAVPLDAVRTAEARIRLAGYTYSSQRVTDALVTAAERGVSVRVLVDGDPVGGTSERQVAALDQLVDAGVSVRVVGGEAARYHYHHAKYVVADDRALVLTENWKPSGSGGRANRGWGVAVRGDATGALADLFAADWQAHDAIPWRDYRETVDPVAGEVATGDYPSEREAKSVTVDRITVLAAPDNAEASMTALVRNATDSVRVEQMAVEGVETPLMQATLDAARNGTRVRVLLSSAWYAEEENGRVVDRLNAIADREDLALDARLVDPDGRFEKIHAKGVVVDSRHVVVGSVNWNRHSLRENREVALVLTGEEVGAYYAAAFDSDWSGGAPDDDVPPVLLGAAVVVVVAVVALLRGSVEFE
ncbi:phospholipase D-like domain-containing protein [Haloarchaeobius sp. DFWS5]|uniref:phospholipase D-like domain-containing protein n=1 Tax=Haloarchaeobius sp. DFWS5 TaxID=3446114 RepID=UPI003EBDC14C